MHASSDDFDFTEPASFEFPGGHENSMDSGVFEPQVHDHSGHAGHEAHAEGMFDAEHADSAVFEGGEFETEFPGGHSGEHPGGTTDMPDFGAEDFHGGESIPEAEASEAAVADAEVVDEEKPAPKKRRRLPKSIRRLEWSLIGGLPLVAIVFNIIAIRMFPAKTIDLIWNLSYLVLLALIPYAMWRSKDRWITPRITASYTVMLAAAAACLLSGIWMMGIDLSGYDWRIKVKKVHLPTPLPAASTQIMAPKSLSDLQSNFV